MASVFDRYCAYEWISGDNISKPDLLALPTLANETSLNWLSPDCDVTPMSHPAIEAGISTIEENFLGTADRVAMLPLADGQLAPTRVTVVDSSLTAAPPATGSGRLEHGRVVGMLIDRLTCPEPTNCLGGVGHVLALKSLLTAQGVVTDSVNGGHFGSLTDLANAIIEAVTSAEGRGETKKIINLSLAWAPRFGGSYSNGDYSSLPPPMRAVREAIGYAVCKGAIVIAAAGNSSHGPSAIPGAAFPARWETQPAPDAAECALYGVPSAPAPSVTSYRPLLYAAGGVTDSDKPVFNARENGMPSLVAPASHVGLSDVDLSGNAVATQVYTGSSMAAAVVSSAASLAWSYRPDLAGPDVMDLIYTASIDLGVDSNFAFNQSARNQHRVSICAVVNAACTGANCSTSCSVRPAHESAPQQPLPQPTVVTPSLVSANNLVYGIPVSAPCESTVFSSNPSGATNPCPSRQYDPVDTYATVRPQPDEPLCLPCTLSQSAELVINLSGNLPGELTNPVLVVKDLNGDKTNYALDIEPDQLMPEMTIEVTDLDLNVGNLIEASLEFIVDGEYSTADLVIITD